MSGNAKLIKTQDEQIKISKFGKFFLKIRILSEFVFQNSEINQNEQFFATSRYQAKMPASTTLPDLCSLIDTAFSGTYY